MAERINIANIAKGALVEQADTEIKKILENIADPNTDIKKKRTLTIKVDFIPTDRESSVIQIQTKSSIVPYNAVTTQVYIGKDSDGTVVAEEFVKGQMKDQVKIDEDTGEILSQPTSKGKKILNINR
jgi:hypothetical protein